MNAVAKASSVQPFVFLSRRFGLSGLVLAGLGLLFSLLCPVIEEVRQPPTKQISQVLNETAHQIKDKLTKPDLGIEAERRLAWNRFLRGFAALLGFVGATLGTASWVRREDLKLAGIAVGVGLAAIAWNFFLLSILAALALLLLAWILSQFA